jgi:hypothetical protein
MVGLCMVARYYFLEDMGSLDACMHNSPSSNSRAWSSAWRCRYWSTCASDALGAAAERECDQPLVMMWGWTIRWRGHDVVHMRSWRRHSALLMLWTASAGGIEFSFVTWNHLNLSDGSNPPDDVCYSHLISSLKTMYRQFHTRSTLVQNLQSQPVLLHGPR